MLPDKSRDATAYESGPRAVSTASAYLGGFGDDGVTKPAEDFRRQQSGAQRFVPGDVHHRHHNTRAAG